MTATATQTPDKGTTSHAHRTTLWVAHIDDHGMREQSVHETCEAAREWVEAGLRSRWMFLFDTPAPATYRALVRESWNEGRGVSCAINIKHTGA